MLDVVDNELQYKIIIAKFTAVAMRCRPDDFKPREKALLCLDKDLIKSSIDDAYSSVNLPPPMGIEYGLFDDLIKMASESLARGFHTFSDGRTTPPSTPMAKENVREFIASSCLFPGQFAAPNAAFCDAVRSVLGMERETDSVQPIVKLVELVGPCLLFQEVAFVSPWPAKIDISKTGQVTIQW